MADATQTTTTRAAGDPSLFGAIVLIINGVFNFIQGWAMIDKASYFQEQVIFTTNFDTWGWIALIFGALQIIGGIMITKGSGFGLGVTLAAIGATFWFFLLFAAPFSAIIGVLINILVIWSLTTRQTAA